MALVMKILLSKMLMKIVNTLISVRCQWKKQYFKTNLLCIVRDSNISSHISKLVLQRERLCTSSSASQKLYIFSDLLIGKIAHQLIFSNFICRYIWEVTGYAGQVLRAWDPVYRMKFLGWGGTSRNKDGMLA